MTVRDERAAAITRLNRLATDDFTAFRARLLDDLDAIDRKQVPGGIVPGRTMTDEAGAELAAKLDEAVKSGCSPVVITSQPTDAQLTAWIRTHDREFAAWVRKQDRISGDGQRALGTAPAEQVAAPAKPAPRRRTRT